MKYLYLVILFTAQFAYSQDYNSLTAEERAYLFHIVKKSPILENNIGRFFEYSGPEVTFANGEIHYDSIEEIMINQPELLIIRKEEIAKSPKGLLAEAANKMAIWELNKALLAHKKDDEDHAAYLNRYDEFERLLIGHLPMSAFKSRQDSLVLHPKLDNLFNSSLSLDDKKGMLQSFRFLNQQEGLEVLLALNYATNTFVENRAREIYFALGGKADTFQNTLVAAGDGSSTSGLLNEREKDEKGRWNKGLPKAVGLFPYQVKIVEREKDKKRVSKEIEPARISKNEYLTVGNNRMTNLHFDVWGYNSEKQTTVVIEKNGRAYRLFGSGDTRFLTPDSAFAGKGTYQGIINDLEFNKIAKLDDLIYGKKGFDYYIAYNTKKKDETELKIEKTEKRYSDYGYKPITTSKKAAKNTRSASTDSQKSERAKTQNEIVQLYGLYDGYKRKIKELEEEKANALDLLSTYQIRLEYFKRSFGQKPMTFVETNGLFVFEDSTTFDVMTQEFTFPASPDTVPFEVRLIAIPESCLSENADEVMLHINLLDAEPNYNARIQLKLEDVFASDAYYLKQNLFGPEDSVAVRLLFEGLLDKKVDFKIVARGNGIGKWDGNTVTKDPEPMEEESYPGETAEEKAVRKMDSTYARLRLSEVFVNLNRGITLEVNSFTDPVVSNVKVTNPDLAAQFSKYNWSKNEILSAMRTYAILAKMKEELNVLAGTYMTRVEAKIIIDRINKELLKTKISIGENSVKCKI